MPILSGLVVAPHLIRWIGYAVAAVAVLLLIWWAAVVPRMELRDERAHHAATKAACAEMRAQWATELAAAHTRARQQEQQLQATVDDARRTLDETRTVIAEKDRALVAARTDARGLRNQLAKFAAAVPVSEGASAAGSAVASLAEVAGAGIELLSEGRDLLRECAKDHDTVAAEKEALIAAWPR